MTALFTFARDSESLAPYFAVVADDKGADYVWPPDVEPWFDAETRFEYLLAGGDEPTDVQGWLNLATTNLGSEVTTDPPFDDASSIAAAKKMASDYLKAAPSAQVTQTSPVLAQASEAYDQAAADYPELGDDGTAYSNPEALDNLVLMALGPIDPDGPNGWILRAMDGNPREGDENEYVHFPGMIDSDSSEEASE